LKHNYWDTAWIPESGKRKGEHYKSGMQCDKCQRSEYENSDPRRTLKRMITVRRRRRGMMLGGESKSELRARPPDRESEKDLILDFWFHGRSSATVTNISVG
jgi:hypothetical protein